MKLLKDKLYESLLDDEEDLINDNSALIDEYLKKYYSLKGTYIIKNGVVDVNGSINVTDKSITQFTNGLFEFGEINGSFNAYSVRKLTTLKGAPKKIRFDFVCTDAELLTDLTGCPPHVGQDLVISGCDGLKNLKGAPEYIGGSIYANACSSLTTLTDLPKYKNPLISVFLEDCSSLKSLKGLPAANEYSFFGCDISDIKYLQTLGLKSVGLLNLGYCYKLSSLEGCPETVSCLDCSDIKIKNFVGGPKQVLGNLYINDLNLESLDGFPNKVTGDIYAKRTKLSVNMLLQLSDFAKSQGVKLIRDKR